MPRDTTRAPAHPEVTLMRQVVGEVRQELRRKGAIPSPPLVNAEPANIEVLDLEGNLVERHTFMLGVDTLGSKSARLKVNGRKRSYLT